MATGSIADGDVTGSDCIDRPRLESPGQPASARRRRSSPFGIQFLLPFGLICACGIAPFLVVAVQSFTNLSLDGRWSTAISLSGYRDLIEPYRVAMYEQIFMRACRVATIDILVAIPISFALIRILRPQLRMLCLALFTLPLLSSDATRAFGWTTVLSNHGVLDNLLTALRMSGFRPDSIIYNETGVSLALIASTMAFGVFAITGSLASVPPTVWQLVRDLGLRVHTEMWRIVIPLSLPGVVLGWVACMVIAVGSSAEVSFLGGANQVSFALIVSDLESARKIPAVFGICTIAAAIIVIATGLLPLVQVLHRSLVGRVARGRVR